MSPSHSILYQELPLVQRRPMLTSMTSDPWRERTTAIRWPDKDAGPYLVSVGWRLLGERWECVELALTIAKEGELRPLHTVDLRALRLPAIVAKAAVVLREELAQEREQVRASQTQPTSRAEFRKMLLERRRADEALRAAQPHKPGRPPVPDSELQQVARIYFDAYHDHRPPTQAVAEAFGLSSSAAAKRVARCRAVGFLGPAEQGKAGTGMLMGRGGSVTLASQIEIDKIREQRRRDDPEGVGEP
jgi:hypothetical protein